VDRTSLRRLRLQRLVRPILCAVPENRQVLCGNEEPIAHASELLPVVRADVGRKRRLQELRGVVAVPAIESVNVLARCAGNHQITYGMAPRTNRVWLPRIGSASPITGESASSALAWHSARSMSGWESRPAFSRCACVYAARYSTSTTSGASTYLCAE
jgi:hypothetical protein